MFLVTHGPYTDSRLHIQMPAGELVIHPDRVEWFKERLAYCGAPDIIVRELSRDEYRVRVLKTLGAIKNAAVSS